MKKSEKTTKNKEFHSVFKVFQKRQRELNSAKNQSKKKEFVLNLAPFFLQLLSLICFKCLAVFHVINK